MQIANDLRYFLLLSLMTIFYDSCYYYVNGTHLKIFLQEINNGSKLHRNNYKIHYISDNITMHNNHIYSSATSQLLWMDRFTSYVLFVLYVFIYFMFDINFVKLLT